MIWVEISPSVLERLKSRAPGGLIVDTRDKDGLVPIDEEVYELLLQMYDDVDTELSNALDIILTRLLDQSDDAVRRLIDG